MDVSLMGSALLRLAIRLNLVSFPSQVPTLTGRQCRDIPERAAQSDFVRGWSVRNICDGFNLNKAVVRKILSEWSIRATAGYFQDIDPGTLEALARPHHARRDEEEDPQGEVFPTTILAMEHKFDSGALMRASGPPTVDDQTVSAAQKF